MRMLAGGGVGQALLFSLWNDLNGWVGILPMWMMYMVWLNLFKSFKCRSEMSCSMSVRMFHIASNTKFQLYADLQCNSFNLTLFSFSPRLLIFYNFCLNFCRPFLHSTLFCVNVLWFWSPVLWFGTYKHAPQTPVHVT